MAWVRMSSTVMGNADHSLDAGTCTSLQNRLQQAYDDSNVDLANYMLPNQSTGNYHAVIGPVGTADTFEYATEVPVMPILARSQQGATWRDVKLTISARVEDTNDTYTVRVYLAPSASTYTLDATGGILGDYPYDDAEVSGTSWGNYALTISPGVVPCGTLYGDGSVTGISVPVWWVHVVVSADGDSDALYVRGPRLREDC